MRKLTVVLIAALAIQLGLQCANACGDKTMRVRGGLRYYQTRAANHPSTILIDSAALPAGKAAALSEELNKVGHKAVAVDGSSIRNRLKTSQYDLVMTTLAEAPQLQRQIESFTPKTVVVPVLFNQPKSEQKAAKEQYKVIVKNPDRLEDFLIAVVRVMDSRSKKS